MNIRIDKLSKKYKVAGLGENEVEAVFQLCSQNTLYYEYCPPVITREGVREDMEMLPSGKAAQDKYFVGYYEKEKLVAVLDLIDGYPDDETAYIGLFMTDIFVQGNGVGTVIIEELCHYLKTVGFGRVELAWVKGNPQSEKFWKKNHFKPMGERSSNAAAHVIAAERKLNEINVRKATTDDLSRIAEIYVFNNRVNYLPIFKDVGFSFGELQVVPLADHYFGRDEIISTIYVLDDGLVKGFIQMNGTETWISADGRKEAGGRYHGISGQIRTQG